MTQLHELHEYFRISMVKSSFYHVFQNTHNHNKAISDAKWLPMFTSLKSKIWRHDQLFDVMTNFLTSCVFLTSWWTLSWSIFDFMNSFSGIRYIMKLCFWSPNERFYVMTCFWLYDKLFDIMTSFWHPDKLVLVMTNLLSSWHVFFTPWRLF